MLCERGSLVSLWRARQGRTRGVVARSLSNGGWREGGEVGRLQARECGRGAGDHRGRRTFVVEAPPSSDGLAAAAAARKRRAEAILGARRQSYTRVLLLFASGSTKARAMGAPGDASPSVQKWRWGSRRCLRFVAAAAAGAGGRARRRTRPPSAASLGCERGKGPLGQQSSRGTMINVLGCRSSE